MLFIAYVIGTIQNMGCQYIVTITGAIVASLDVESQSCWNTVCSYTFLFVGNHDLGFIDSVGMLETLKWYAVNL